jgi:hypothetical protein
MSLPEAQALAERVRAATPHTVSVEAEDPYFVVVVAKASGDTWTVRDEQDWDWMHDRISSD